MKLKVRPLHPQDAAKVLINFFGSLALAAASEEAVGSRECVCAEYKLIFLPSTKWASLPVKFSAHGPDSSNLFVHKTSGEWESHCGDPAGDFGAVCVMTRVCSTIPSKEEGENTVEEGRATKQKRGEK